MRRLILGAAKGGCGKSTTAINLAAGFALGGARVALLDLDPYAGATSGLGLTPEESTFADVLTRGAPIMAAIRETTVSGLSVLPGGIGLADAGRRLASKPLALRGLLEGLKGFSVLILDTPPAVGPLSVAAFAAGGELLVPVVSSFFDLATVAPFIREAADVRRTLAPDLVLRALIPSRVTRTRIALEVLETLRKNYPETTRTEIRQTTGLVESAAAGEPIQVYAPSSTGAEDFNALTRELAREKK